MRVVELKDELEGMGFQLAVVESDGLYKDVRLDLVDTVPEIGDYLIIHAGFAINRLSEEDALINLNLMREMVAALENKGSAGNSGEESS
jgi:hydrogenase expression/formation protein HypC